MRLPNFIRERLLDRAFKVAYEREPDFVISAKEGEIPYLRRWWLIPRNKWFNIYLHHFSRSDDDRAVHDHPWANASILLAGSYIEHVPTRGASGIDYQNTMALPRQEGSVVVRCSGKMAHRVELYRGTFGYEIPVWTLFITGPKTREWGFRCPKGWRHWKDFCDPKDPGRPGPGCG